MSIDLNTLDFNNLHVSTLITKKNPKTKLTTRSMTIKVKSVCGSYYSPLIIQTPNLFTYGVKTSEFGSSMSLVLIPQDLPENKKQEYITFKNKLNEFFTYLRKCVKESYPEVTKSQLDSINPIYETSTTPASFYAKLPKNYDAPAGVRPEVSHGYSCNFYNKKTDQKTDPDTLTKVMNTTCALSISSLFVSNSVIKPQIKVLECEFELLEKRPQQGRLIKKTARVDSDEDINEDDDLFESEEPSEEPKKGLLDHIVVNKKIPSGIQF